MSHRFLHFSAEIKLLLFPPQPLQVNLNIQDTKVIFNLRGIVYKIQRSSFFYTALFTRYRGRLSYTRDYLQDIGVVFHVHGIIYRIQRLSVIYVALFTRYNGSLS